MKLPRVSLILTWLFISLLLPRQSSLYADELHHEIIRTQIASDTDNKCVLRDKYGFLWVGTDNGLDCYDGSGQHIYLNNSGPLGPISNVYVSTLFEKGENILIGGNVGLYIFDRQSNAVKRFPYKTKYNITVSAMVEKILDADDQTTWISTQGQGFFIFNNADKTLVQNSRYGSFYSDMAIGSDGLIYLASINGKIQAFRPDGEFIKEIRLPGYTTDKNGISVQSSGDDIWISVGSNLYRLDTTDNSIEKVLPNDAKLIINTLLARPDGSLLLGTNTGLWRYDPLAGTGLEYVDTNTGHALNYDVRVEELATDDSDNIILVHPTGTLEVMTYMSSDFKFVPLPTTGSGLGFNLVRAIAPSSDRSGLWIGSDNGLFYYDTNSGAIRKITPPASIECNSITSLLCHADKLAIGTKSNGIIVYNTATNDWRQFVYNEDVPYSIISNEINDIYRTSNGDVYILTNWGICRYDPVAGNFPQLTEFGQQIRAVAMSEDFDNCLWIATSNNGLYFRAPGDERFSNNYHEGYNLTVKMMHIDRNGNLWAATKNNGIMVFDHEKREFTPFTNAVLSGKPTLFFCNGKSGELCIGANNFMLKHSNDGSTAVCDFIHNDKWMPVPGVISPLGDGRSVIGCCNGFLIFDPDKLKLTADRIRIYPLSVSFPFAESDNDALKRLGLDILLYAGKSIKLPYDNNTFTIKLASDRPLTLPDVKYDYMLEGVDKSWITGVSTPEITYNNVPPGKYSLLLRPYGIQDSEVSSLVITVLSPWYMSGWAYLVYFILTLLLAWGVFVILRRILRRKYRRQLKDLRIQKEREVFEAKTRYFVDLVHEIRTPLMLISLPLEQLTEALKRDAATVNKSGNMNYIKSMQRNIDYLLGITNQLLDFRKAENNSEIQLNLKRCNISAMLRNICRRFEEPMAISGKKLTLTLPSDDIMVTIDADKSERLFMNLIGNAMKYARHEVSITLSEIKDDKVQLSVADDGPGVPVEERARIFDTYYQIGNDNVAAALGTGLGLAYAKLIAVAHHGCITVGDSEAGGALFVLEIPKGDDLQVAESVNLSEFVDGDKECDNADYEPGVTVLLVEDNQDLRSMISGALGRRYKVITADDGEIALGLLAENDVNIIVSDVMMPRMDGMELCRRVKTDVRYSHIPFIILTAKTGEDAHEEGMKCGADVYLEKPFPIRQLIYQISNILRTRKLFYELMRKNTSTGTVEAAVAADVSVALNRVDAEFLDRMNAIIRDSIANEEFSIDVLADKMSMSRSSFYRKITGVVGMSPSDYLKNFRLNRAAELLCEGCRVTEVSDRVGFTSSSYFAKCFRDKFGVLPSEYVSTVWKSENGH